MSSSVTQPADTPLTSIPMRRTPCMFPVLLHQCSPPGLWHDHPLGYLHVLAEKRFYHRRPTILSTYPGFLPLLECAPILLYADTPSYFHMNPGVNVIALILPRFICSLTHSKILTTSVSVICTHMELWPDMRPSSS